MHPWDRTEPNKPSPASVKAASASRQRKLYTLVLPLDLTSGRILLGFKKRGFGAQKCQSTCVITPLGSVEANAS